MKVFRALPPSTDVNPFDAVDGRDGAVDAADHHAQLSGQIKEHKRKAAWFGGGTDAPVGVAPQVFLIERRASLTVDAALTRTRHILGGWGLKCSGAADMFPGDESFAGRRGLPGV
ncbi:MAG TPA: hypothetical protein VJW23_16895, partial [Propionibacteriaceae bacterium]|nr:hypothetical protein [Propionibacteriaceae bacterium]